MPDLIVYTDGAAINNPGKGGYGIVMLWGTARKELYGSFRNTTNNRMELLAVIVALESVKRPDINIIIYTDSKYVCESVEKRWVWSWRQKGWKDKKNIDLWKRFLLAYEPLKVKMKWVKGHAGNVENERCDVLATDAARFGPWEIDAGYEAIVASEPKLL
ncbi:MAG: ribonuclease HI [Bacteroidia bacterium]|nr:ribonuclease HI [Bacteroidia bacterium]